MANQKDFERKFKEKQSKPVTARIAHISHHVYSPNTMSVLEQSCAQFMDKIIVAIKKELARDTYASPPYVYVLPPDVNVKGKRHASFIILEDGSADALMQFDVGAVHPTIHLQLNRLQAPYWRLVYLDDVEMTVREDSDLDLLAKTITDERLRRI